MLRTGLLPGCSSSVGRGKAGFSWVGRPGGPCPLPFQTIAAILFSVFALSVDWPSVSDNFLLIKLVASALQVLTLL